MTTLVAKGPRSADYFLGNMFQDKTPVTGRSTSIAKDSSTMFVHYEGWMLSGYSGGDVTFKIPWFSLSVTTGSIRLNLSLEHNVENGNPMNGSNFGTVKSVTTTVSSTLSALKYAQIVLTNADMNGLVGSSAFRIKLERQPGHAGDNMVGNSHFLMWAAEQA